MHVLAEKLAGAGNELSEEQILPLSGLGVRVRASYPGLTGPSTALGAPSPACSAPWLRAALGCFGSVCHPVILKACVEGTWCRWVFCFEQAASFQSRSMGWGQMSFLPGMGWAREGGHMLEPSAGILLGVLGALWPFSILMAPVCLCDDHLSLCGSGCPTPGQGKNQGDFRAGWKIPP